MWGCEEEGQFKCALLSREILLFREAGGAAVSSVLLPESSKLPLASVQGVKSLKKAVALLSSSLSLTRSWIQTPIRLSLSLRPGCRPQSESHLHQN